MTGEAFFASNLAGHGSEAGRLDGAFVRIWELLWGGGNEYKLRDGRFQFGSDKIRNFCGCFCVESNREDLLVIVEGRFSAFLPLHPVRRYRVRVNLSTSVQVSKENSFFVDKRMTDHRR